MNHRAAAFFSVAVALWSLGAFGASKPGVTWEEAAGQNDLNCEAAGKTEIKIECRYSVKEAGNDEGAKIALERVLITFDAAQESHMHVDLTFQNIGKTAFAEKRTVYIEFDDPAGRNYIRRPLPNVDFQKLAPRVAKTFSDIFLAPKLPPGRYLVGLWIPNSDPALRFNPSYNLSLSNIVKRELGARLNQIASVTIERAR